MDQALDYNKIAQYVGKLYLEFSHQVDREREQNANLYAEVDRLRNLLQSDNTREGNAS